MAEFIQTEARQKQIDALCKNIIKQFEQGQNREAVDGLKRALERYPESPQLRGLHSQIQQKVKASKIKKLEYEAMVLIQKGSENEGQKKLREIYLLDPSRTELKNAATMKSREESRLDFEVSTRQNTVRQLYYKWLTAVVIVAILSTIIAGWSNRRHLSKARKHMDNGNYPLAVAELNDCGWLMAGSKPQLQAELATIEDEARAKAEDIGKGRDYASAIELMRKAMSASKFPADYNESIQNLQKLKQNEDQAHASALRLQQDCLCAQKTASGKNAETDAASFWEQAAELAAKAEAMLAADQYVQANEQWLKSIEQYKLAEQTAVRVQENRGSAKVAHEQCLQKAVAAQKMCAQIETPLEWAKATDLAAAAENLFEEQDYVKAEQTWNQSSKTFDEAVNSCRQSPSYQAAIERISKWRELHLDMSEKAVTALLGEPLCRIADSDRCIMYYQDLPKLLRTGESISNPLEPAAGYMIFQNKGLDFAVENARLVFEKELGAENRRYESELKRSKKMAQESTRIPGQQNPQVHRRNVQDAENAIYAEHEKKLRKINADYVLVQNNFNQNVTPIIPVYLSIEWSVPEPNNIAALLSSADPLLPVFEIKWHSPENWTKLKSNMELKYVENLLGNLFGMGTAAEKSYQLGNTPGFGKLHFVRGKDGEPRLSYWKEPFWPEVSNSIVPAERQISDPNSFAATVSDRKLDRKI